MPQNYKELQCAVDKVSIAFFISPGYDSVAAAGLCKQKYLFVLLHAHIHFNEDVSDVIRLACVLHCAVILLIFIFFLRVLCLRQRPKEIKCKAKLGPQNLTVSSQEIRRWLSTTLNIKCQRTWRGGSVSPPHRNIVETQKFLFNTHWCGWPLGLGLLGDSPRPFLIPLASPTRKPEISQLVTCVNSTNCRRLLFEKNQYYMSM